jgi:hypothetical protein
MASCSREARNKSTPASLEEAASSAIGNSEFADTGAPERKMRPFEIERLASASLLRPQGPLSPRRASRPVPASLSGRAEAGNQELAPSCPDGAEHAELTEMRQAWPTVGHPNAGQLVIADPMPRRARIHARGASASGGSRPAEAPIDGQLVCYYPCPRCSNPARALVYLGDSALASEVVAQAEDEARHLGLLAVGAGLALNGGHSHWGGRDCHLSLWTEPPAALAGAGRAARCVNGPITFVPRRRPSQRALA